MSKSNYDPTVHSKSKLGLVGFCPVLPFPATAAQMRVSGGSIHFRVLGGESYVTGSMRGTIPPARIKATLKAVMACPSEPSWSGSDSEYHSLTIVGDGSNGVQVLMAGDTEVCRIMIDPTWTLISSDESLESQMGDDEEPTGGPINGDDE